MFCADRQIAARFSVSYHHEGPCGECTSTPRTVSFVVAHKPKKSFRHSKAQCHHHHHHHITITITNTITIIIIIITITIAIIITIAITIGNVRSTPPKLA